MPRSARLVMDGGTYHVLTRGNNGQPIFHEDQDYRRYLDLLRSHVRQHEIKVYHFMLMPNHVHLIMEVPLAETLSKVMSGINLAYSWVYRKRYRYSGHLWQGRFLSLMIDQARGLMGCGRYIELSPVRAGLASHPNNYRWSSYHAYANGVAHPLLAPHPLYRMIGTAPQERQGRYRQFIQEGLALHTIPAAGKMLPDGLEFPMLKKSLGRPRKLETLLPKNAY